MCSLEASTKGRSTVYYTANKSSCCKAVCCCVFSHQWWLRLGINSLAFICKVMSYVKGSLTPHIMPGAFKHTAICYGCIITCVALNYCVALPLVFPCTGPLMKYGYPVETLNKKATSIPMAKNAATAAVAAAAKGVHIVAQVRGVARECSIRCMARMHHLMENENHECEDEAIRCPGYVAFAMHHGHFGPYALCTLQQFQPPAHCHTHPQRNNQPQYSL